MPQLNPAPWFTILVFSWFVFLTVVPLKVVAHTFPNEPMLPGAELMLTEAWAWPWY
uniref:ATP synthase complex subunit 8 n=1 Tax=Neopomacentrus sindensis TaxID=229129 RepID=Q7Y6P5_9TELE|nr:ATP synthase 8 [Neopomacentrus sindensis]AAP75387.1 ATP synthase 8 [Neopomacentrus sindensis]